MLLLLFNQPTGTVGPVYARAPAGSGYTRPGLQVIRPGSPVNVRPPQQNTTR